MAKIVCANYRVCHYSGVSLIRLVQYSCVPINRCQILCVTNIRCVNNHVSIIMFLYYQASGIRLIKIKWVRYICQYAWVQEVYPTCASTSSVLQWELSSLASLGYSRTSSLEVGLLYMHLSPLTCWWWCCSSRSPGGAGVRGTCGHRQWMTIWRYIGGN